MDRLASCYFCGTALDDEVTERPVVPEQLASDEHREATVVVCRGCDRKLDRVLAAVVNAVREPDRREGATGRDGGDDDALPDDPTPEPDAETPAEADDGSDGSTAETTVSALEYNKVMRLVQNREFPVDRAEIEEVAASAYQISPEACRRVIDEAIERDLLSERDGEIVPKE